MPKAKRKKAKRVTDMGDTPTPEQMRKGDGVRGTVTHVETQTHSIAHRMAHDPIKRWEKDKKLTDVQVATIERMQTLWHLVHGEQKLCGSYSEPLSAPSSGNWRDVNQSRFIALRDDLRDIEALFDGVTQWYSVFERICRWGMSPVAVCGNRERALTTVRFVADFINTKGY